MVFQTHCVWYGAQNINTCLASGSSIAIWTGAYVWINTESAIGTSRPKIKENQSIKVAFNNNKKILNKECSFFCQINQCNIDTKPKCNQRGLTYYVICINLGNKKLCTLKQFGFSEIAGSEMPEKFAGKTYVLSQINQRDPLYSLN